MRGWGGGVGGVLYSGGAGSPDPPPGPPGPRIMLSTARLTDSPGFGRIPKIRQNMTCRVPEGQKVDNKYAINRVR